MAAQRAHPALVRHHHRDRLALDQHFGEFLLDIAHGAEGGAALAERRLRPEGVAHLPDFVRDRLPLLVFGFEQALQLLQLVAKILVLAPDLHLFQLAQVAQPHVEDGVGLHFGELEGLDQDRLRLILGADDLDHLVEVQIGDQIAAEHFQPMLDRIDPVLAAAHQHVAAMVEPFAQAPRRGRSRAAPCP